MDLTPVERDLVETARERILTHSRQRREAGLDDVIHAVARSDAGAHYEGMPLEEGVGQFGTCAERHALANLQYAETEAASLEAVLVAGPVPDADHQVVTPCGGCRHVIHAFGPDATVLCSSFVREAEGWTIFPRIERYTVAELYPDAPVHPDWEGSDE